MFISKLKRRLPFYGASNFYGIVAFDIENVFEINCLYAALPREVSKCIFVKFCG